MQKRVKSKELLQEIAVIKSGYLLSSHREFRQALLTLERISSPLCLNATAKLEVEYFSAFLVTAYLEIFCPSWKPNF
jgi:hypothetical protein